MIKEGVSPQDSAGGRVASTYCTPDPLRMPSHAPTAAASVLPQPRRMPFATAATSVPLQTPGPTLQGNRVSGPAPLRPEAQIGMNPKQQEEVRN